MTSSDDDFSKISNLEVSIPELKKELLSDTAKCVFTPDQQRKEHEKKHIHNLTIVLLWGLAMFATIIAFVVMLHLIFPKKWRWLTSEDVMGLKSIFVSGIGGAILAKFGNKLTGK